MSNGTGIFYLSPETIVKDGDTKDGGKSFETFPEKEKEVVKTIPAPGWPNQKSNTRNSQKQDTLPPSFHSGAIQSPELVQPLRQLSELIANITEAYTIAIFLADREKKVLMVAAAHSLSREFLPEAEVPFGRGLVGWTAENSVRISVSPFEHDSTTLLYYSKNQDLKSFTAVPILDSAKRLLGVIACDSKKNYAFAKITEKVLSDCAVQAANIICLSESCRAARGGLRSGHLGSKPPGFAKEWSLPNEIEKLRNIWDEKTLLSRAAELPYELVQRDALVVMTTSEGGIGVGRYYSSSTEARVGHRLLELVCNHKKVLCPERSVHVLPADDQAKRSFLSVPFHVLDREAGSINLLSRPLEAFSAVEIEALEKVAAALGIQLEHIRLRDRFSSVEQAGGTLSWKQFCIKAQARLAERIPLTLIRVALNNLLEVEDFFGIEAATAAASRVMRLASQVARPPSITACVYGSQILMLVETAEAPKIIQRFQRLIERLEAQELSESFPGCSVKIGEILARGMEIVSAGTSKDGSSLQELLSHTKMGLELAKDKQLNEAVANVGNW